MLKIRYHKKEPTLCFSGLARSGNHAIILWYLNNIAPSTALGNSAYYDLTTKKYIYFNNISKAGYRGFDRRIDEFDSLIYSYEDEDTQRPNTFFIGRDFVNLLASRQKKFAAAMNCNGYCCQIQDLMDMWVIHHLKPNIILYNFWVSHKWYRDSCAAQLNIPNDVDNNKIVSEIGEGSSFIGIKLDERKNYLERYKLVSIKEEIKEAILSNYELRRINIDMYGIDVEQCLKESK